MGDRTLNVLIVDDQPSQRTMFRHLVEDISPDIRVTDFGDPIEALGFSQLTPPDLLLLDYRMPKLDGLEFTRRFRQPLSNRDVPIILITVVGDEPTRNAALEAGVIDFLVKPVRPRELRSRCRNLLMLRQQQQSLKSRSFDLERRLLSSMRELDEREREILFRLARATEFRDDGTGAHLERMARYSGLIAEEMGLPDEDVRLIELAAPLHDIGKIGIPDAILRKPARLSPEEFAVMKTHARMGYDILSESSSRFVQMGATIALRHHEHWDGGGYPDGIAGEAIPLPGRIVALADVFDALTTARAYKEAWPLDVALEYVQHQSGRQFDRGVVAALVRRREQAEEIRHQFAPAAAPER